jgi:hypothetical protein
MGTTNCVGIKNLFSPLCIYGGRINFLNIWKTNNDPKVIGRFYYNYLQESRGMYLGKTDNRYSSRQPSIDVRIAYVMPLLNNELQCNLGNMWDKIYTGLY